MRLKKLIQYALNVGIINTIRFNFHYFSWGGVIHPYIIVAKKLKILELGGYVKIEEPKIGCIKIGFPLVGIFDYKYERSLWENSGTIKFCSRASLNQGSRISNSGVLSFGDRFSISANSSIICTDKITFGDDVLISWDSLIMDTDFHGIFDVDTHEMLNHSSAIYIGDHTWICCRTTILKGTRIGCNNIVAAGSVITGHYENENAIICSNKKILKKNVNWKK